MEDNARLVEFMHVTSCYYTTVAVRHLSSCGWELDRAVDLFYAGFERGKTSARDGGEASTSASLRDPISARSETLYGVPYPYAATRQPRCRPTRWESEEAAALRRQREGEASTSGYGGGADADDVPVPVPLPTAKRRKTTLEELFRAPRGLTYKGGFHDAKVHAARLSRWLVVNVQAGGEFASHVQNRDVGADETVAGSVRDNFVLWQVDADDEEDGGGGGGSKFCCYYKLDRAKLPAVLFVDPVTGQLMKKLHHVTDASDFLMAADKFTRSKPAMPIRANRATVTLPPSLNHQEQPTAAAAGSPGEKLCRLTVWLPDGQAVTKELGSQCGVDALFTYCRSVIGGEQPFRLMRMRAPAGAREEVREKDVSFEHLGLNMSTVCVLLD